MSPISVTGIVYLTEIFNMSVLTSSTQTRYKVKLLGDNYTPFTANHTH